MQAARLPCWLYCRIARLVKPTLFPQLVMAYLGNKIGLLPRLLYLTRAVFWRFVGSPSDENRDFFIPLLHNNAPPRGKRFQHAHKLRNSFILHRVNDSRGSGSVAKITAQKYWQPVSDQYLALSRKWYKIPPLADSGRLVCNLSNGVKSGDLESRSRRSSELNNSKMIRDIVRFLGSHAQH